MYSKYKLNCVIGLTVSGKASARNPATTVTTPQITIGRGCQTSFNCLMIRENTPPTLATALQLPMALFLFNSY